MLSKSLLALTAGVVTADASILLSRSDGMGRFSRTNRNVMMKLRNSNAHPTVQMAPGCSSSLDVLKAGPANIPKIIQAETQYVDPNFG